MAKPRTVAHAVAAKKRLPLLRKASPAVAKPSTTTSRKSNPPIQTVQTDIRHEKVSDLTDPHAQNSLQPPFHEIPGAPQDSSVSSLTHLSGHGPPTAGDPIYQEAQSLAEMVPVDSKLIYPVTPGSARKRQQLSSTAPMGSFVLQEPQRKPDPIADGASVVDSTIKSNSSHGSAPRIHKLGFHAVKALLHRVQKVGSPSKRTSRTKQYRPSVTTIPGIPVVLANTMDHSTVVSGTSFRDEPALEPPELAPTTSSSNPPSPLRSMVPSPNHGRPPPPSPPLPEPSPRRANATILQRASSPELRSDSPELRGSPTRRQIRARDPDASSVTGRVSVDAPSAIPVMGIPVDSKAVESEPVDSDAVLRMLNREILQPPPVGTTPKQSVLNNVVRKKRFQSTNPFESSSSSSSSTGSGQEQDENNAEGIRQLREKSTNPFDDTSSESTAASRNKNDPFIALLPRDGIANDPIGGNQESIPSHISRKEQQHATTTSKRKTHRSNKLVGPLVQQFEAVSAASNKEPGMKSECSNVKGPSTASLKVPTKKKVPPEEIALKNESLISDLDQSLRHFPLNVVEAKDVEAISGLEPTGDIQDTLTSHDEEDEDVKQHEVQISIDIPMERVQGALADSITETTKLLQEPDKVVDDNVAMEVLSETCGLSPFSSLLQREQNQRRNEKNHPGMNDKKAADSTPRISNEKGKRPHQTDGMLPGSKANVKEATFFPDNSEAPLDPENETIHGAVPEDSTHAEPLDRYSTIAPSPLLDRVLSFGRQVATMSDASRYTVASRIEHMSNDTRGLLDLSIKIGEGIESDAQSPSPENSRELAFSLRKYFVALSNEATVELENELAYFENSDLNHLPLKNVFKTLRESRGSPTTTTHIDPDTVSDIMKQIHDFGSSVKAAAQRSKRKAQTEGSERPVWTQELVDLTGIAEYDELENEEALWLFDVNPDAPKDEIESIMEFAAKRLGLPPDQRKVSKILSPFAAIRSEGKIVPECKKTDSEVFDDMLYSVCENTETTICGPDKQAYAIGHSLSGQSEQNDDKYKTTTDRDKYHEGVADVEFQEKLDDIASHQVQQSRKSRNHVGTTDNESELSSSDELSIILEKLKRDIQEDEAGAFDATQTKVPPGSKPRTSQRRKRMDFLDFIFEATEGWLCGPKPASPPSKWEATGSGTNQKVSSTSTISKEAMKNDKFRREPLGSKLEVTKLSCSKESPSSATTDQDLFYGLESPDPLNHRRSQEVASSSGKDLEEEWVENSELSTGKITTESESDCQPTSEPTDPDTSKDVLSLAPRSTAESRSDSTCTHEEIRDSQLSNVVEKNTQGGESFRGGETKRDNTELSCVQSVGDFEGNVSSQRIKLESTYAREHEAKCMLSVQKDTSESLSRNAEEDKAAFTLGGMSSPNEEEGEEGEFTHRRNELKGGLGILESQESSERNLRIQEPKVCDAARLKNHQLERTDQADEPKQCNGANEENHELGTSNQADVAPDCMQTASVVRRGPKPETNVVPIQLNGYPTGRPPLPENTMRLFTPNVSTRRNLHEIPANGPPFLSTGEGESIRKAETGDVDAMMLMCAREGKPPTPELLTSDLMVSSGLDVECPELGILSEQASQTQEAASSNTSGRGPAPEVGYCEQAANLAAFSKAMSTPQQFVQIVESGETVLSADKGQPKPEAVPISLDDSSYKGFSERPATFTDSKTSQTPQELTRLIDPEESVNFVDNGQPVPEVLRHQLDDDTQKLDPLPLRSKGSKGSGKSPAHLEMSAESFVENWNDAFDAHSGTNEVVDEYFASQQIVSDSSKTSQKPEELANLINHEETAADVDPKQPFPEALRNTSVDDALYVFNARHSSLRLDPRVSKESNKSPATIAASFAPTCNESNEMCLSGNEIGSASTSSKSARKIVGEYLASLEDSLQQVGEPSSGKSFDRAFDDTFLISESIPYLGSIDESHIGLSSSSNEPLAEFHERKGEQIQVKLQNEDGIDPMPYSHDGTGGSTIIKTEKLSPTVDSKIIKANALGTRNENKLSSSPSPPDGSPSDPTDGMNPETPIIIDDIEPEIEITESNLIPDIARGTPVLPAIEVGESDIAFSLSPSTAASTQPKTHRLSHLSIGNHAGREGLYGPNHQSSTGSTTTSTNVSSGQIKRKPDTHVPIEIQIKQQEASSQTSSRKLEELRLPHHKDLPAKPWSVTKQKQSVLEKTLVMLDEDLSVACESSASLLLALTRSESDSQCDAGTMSLETHNTAEKAPFHVTEDHRMQIEKARSIVLKQYTFGSDSNGVTSPTQVQSPSKRLSPLRRKLLKQHANRLSAGSSDETPSGSPVAQPRSYTSHLSPKFPVSKAQSLELSSTSIGSPPLSPQPHDTPQKPNDFPTASPGTSHISPLRARLERRLQARNSVRLDKNVASEPIDAEALYSEYVKVIDVTDLSTRDLGKGGTNKTLDLGKSGEDRTNSMGQSDEGKTRERKGGEIASEDLGECEDGSQLPSRRSTVEVRTETLNAPHQNGNPHEKGFDLVESSREESQLEEGPVDMSEKPTKGLDTVLNKLRLDEEKKESDVESMDLEDLFQRYDSIVKDLVVLDDERLARAQAKQLASIVHAADSAVLDEGKGKIPSPKSPHSPIRGLSEIARRLRRKSVSPRLRLLGSEEDNGDRVMAARVDRGQKVVRSSSFGSESLYNSDSKSSDDSSYPSAKARQLRKQLEQALDTSARIRSKNDQLGEDILLAQSRVHHQRSMSPVRSRSAPNSPALSGQPFTSHVHSARDSTISSSHTKSFYHRNCYSSSSGDDRIFSQDSILPSTDDEETIQNRQLESIRSGLRSIRDSPKQNRSPRTRRRRKVGF